MLPDPKPQVSNWTDATRLSPAERQLVEAALAIERQFYACHGRCPTMQEIEDYLTGRKQL